MHQIFKHQFSNSVPANCNLRNPLLLLRQPQMPVVGRCRDGRQRSIRSGQEPHTHLSMGQAISINLVWQACSSNSLHCMFLTFTFQFLHQNLKNCLYLCFICAASRAELYCNTTWYGNINPSLTTNLTTNIPTAFIASCKIRKNESHEALLTELYLVY